MVFNATFKTISVVSWRSVLLVEETGIPGKKTSTLHVSHLQTRHIMYLLPTRLSGILTRNVSGDVL
jgi:hypothetical protein